MLCYAHVYLYQPHNCSWMCHIFLTIHSANWKSAIGVWLVGFFFVSFFVFLLWFSSLYSVIPDSFIKHQEHRYGFWALLPLTIRRSFPIWETTARLCDGCWSVFLKLTGLGFDFCGEIRYEQSEEEMHILSWDTFFLKNFSPCLSLVELGEWFSNNESSIPMSPFHYVFAHSAGSKRLIQKGKQSKDLGLQCFGDVINLPETQTARNSFKARALGLSGTFWMFSKMGMKQKHLDTLHSHYSVSY